MQNQGIISYIFPHFGLKAQPLELRGSFTSSFLYRENHALGAWFQRAYSFAQKNSFAIVCKTVWQLSIKKAKEFLYDHTVCARSGAVI